MVGISILENLTFLDLSYSKLTDESILRLEQLNRLTLLNLSGIYGVTNDFLRYLLTIQNNEGRGAGFRLALLDLTSCEWLDDIGMSFFSQMTNLTSLHLGDNRGVTDVGLDLLSHVTGLTFLSLRSNESITDMGYPT